MLAANDAADVTNSNRMAGYVGPRVETAILVSPKVLLPSGYSHGSIRTIVRSRAGPYGVDRSGRQPGAAGRQSAGGLSVIRRFLALAALVAVFTASLSAPGSALGGTPIPPLRPDGPVVLPDGRVLPVKPASVRE